VRGVHTAYLFPSFWQQKKKDDAQASALGQPLCLGKKGKDTAFSPLRRGRGEKEEKAY